MDNPTETLRICIAAAEAAAQEIRQIAGEPLNTRQKQDGSPLTRADMASHHIICDVLRQHTPEWPVISEEDEVATARGDMQHYWLVDPLDGTKEFVAGLPDYTVNIALIQQGNPVLGVILLPATQVLYFATQGGDAWLREPDREAVKISAATQRKRAIAVVSRSHPSAETTRFLERLAITNVIAHGSSLKMCAVADGSADIYPRLNPTWYWDTAAGTIIAREAGCCVTDADGKQLSYSWQKEPRHHGFVVYAPRVCNPFKTR